MKEKSANIDGILVIDKPINLTSRDVVNRVSKVLKTKKIGHTGTLDPLATGVLVLTIGKCTKLSDVLTSKDKTYQVEMKLGYETDTLDKTGKTLYTSDIVPSKNEILSVIKSYQKRYLQEVPIYSAVKVNGKKLYQYARENIAVKLPQKEVIIYDINGIETEGKLVRFTCRVSKGTYIRSLIRDIGRDLNTYATMTSLRRIKQGNFSIEDSYTLDNVEKCKYKLLTISDIMSNINKVDLDEIDYKRVSNGSQMLIDNNSDYIVFTYNNKYVALYKKDDDGKFKMHVKF